MGDETYISDEAPEDKTQMGEVAQTPRIESNSKYNLTTNKKKGINVINKNMKMRGPSSQIPLHPLKKNQENSVTEVTILHDENGGLEQEQEPITIYQPEEEDQDQVTDRDMNIRKNLPRESIKEPIKFSPNMNDTIVQDQTLRYPGMEDQQPQVNIKSTVNLFIEKLQVGVAQVLKENEPAITQFKRSLSSKMPLSRYTRSAHEGQTSMRFANPVPLREGGYQENHGGISLRNKSESRGTRPPLFYGQHPNERPSNTMEKCMQNEIDALKQEKIFVQQRLEQVQQASDEQIRVLQEKLAEKEKKYQEKK